MTLAKNTGFNNIPTENQNFLCQHWSEARRTLQILTSLVNDDDTKASIERIMRRGEEATTLLRKGQPQKRRSLYFGGRRRRCKDG